MWVAREEAIADSYEAMDFQTEYTRDLLGPTDYPVSMLMLVMHS